MPTNGISHRILWGILLIVLVCGSLLLGAPQQAPEKLEAPAWLQVVQPTGKNAAGGSIGAGFSSGAPLALGAGQLLTVYKSPSANELVGATSNDGGRTWTETGVVEQNPDSQVKVVRPILLQTHDGTIWVFYNGFIRYTRDPATSQMDLWVVRSTDGGKTWKDRQCIWKGYAGMLQGVLETKSGSIILPFCYLVAPTRFANGCVLSSDMGKTWRFVPSVIDVSPELDVVRREAGLNGGAIEPAVVELKDGRIWMLTRTITGYLWQSFSKDDGLTWSKATPTSISSGGVLYMTRLASGRLVLVWNRADWSAEPVFHFPKNFYEISVALSEDDGKAWHEPVVVARGKMEVHSFLAEPSPGQLLITLPAAGVLLLGAEKALLKAELDEAKRAASQSKGFRLSKITFQKVRGPMASGAVLDLGKPGAFDSVWVACPSVLYDGKLYRMWYSSFYDSKMGRGGIGLATSPDGIYWTRANDGNPVLTAGPEGSYDEVQAATPQVVREGDFYRMWYAAWSPKTQHTICIAHSSDGIRWERDNNAQPVYGLSPSYAYGPTVYRVGDEYVLLYMSSTRLAPGLYGATSADGIHWEMMNGGAPVVPPGKPPDFDESLAGHACLLRVGDRLWLWYTGYRREAGGTAGWRLRIGLAEALIPTRAN